MTKGNRLIALPKQRRAAASVRQLKKDPRNAEVFVVYRVGDLEARCSVRRADAGRVVPTCASAKGSRCAARHIEEAARVAIHLSVLSRTSASVG